MSCTAALLICLKKDQGIDFRNRLSLAKENKHHSEPERTNKVLLALGEDLLLLLLRGTSIFMKFKV